MKVGCLVMLRGQSERREHSGISHASLSHPEFFTETVDFTEF